ncbi:hypothetical protein PRZ48_001204 [Zasmidium cellare]|uniref:Uncharacterized protein n=1 Tax=Zasmidium cellare TaxID=395010 RepID=A0ABR0F0M3_ZASCE|nr:hypothetical protein PRZ48_001204 [Zasmidium cellare]
MSSSREEAFFGGAWRDDDERIDVYALFVLEEIALTDIENVLRRNEEDLGSASLWLADDYNNLPDFQLDNPPASGTTAPLAPEWQSPFLAKTAQDAAEFLRSVPKPRKPLCKTYFAILDKALYREHDQLLVCKVVNGEVQSIPCAAPCVGVFFTGHDRNTWNQSLYNWQEDGMVLMA